MATQEVIDLCDSDEDSVPPLRKATPTRQMASRSTSAPSPNLAKKQIAMATGGASGDRPVAQALSKSSGGLLERGRTTAIGLPRTQARISGPLSSSSLSKKRPHDDAENPRDYIRSPKRFKFTQAPNSKGRTSTPKEPDRPQSTLKGPHRQTAHAPSALMIDLTNEDTPLQSDEESTTDQQGIFISEHRKRHPLHHDSTTHNPRKRKATQRTPGSNVREQRAEIPESVPGSPEDPRDVPSACLGLRNATPASDRMSTMSASENVAPRSGSSADPSLLTKQRRLPLTPSESSADERISTEARGTEGRNSPARLPRASSSRDSSTVTAAGNLTKGSKAVEQTDGSETVSRREGKINATSRISPLAEPQDIVGPRMYATLYKSTTDVLRRGIEHVRGVSRSLATAGNRSIEDQPIKTSEQVGRLVNRLLDELGQDTGHWTRASLRRARTMHQSQAVKPPDEPTSVFSQMKPLAITAASKQLGKGQAKFESQSVRVNKKSTWTAPYTGFDEKDEDVPPYSNVVRIQRNFLANNESTLQHAPYFDEDTDIGMDVFAEVYHVDVGMRGEKLLDLSKAEHLAECAEEILKTAGCRWEDVLRFLLEETPDVGTNHEAQRALIARDTMSDVGPFRNSKRWGALIHNLPDASPVKTGIAGLVCDWFYRKARFSFWHLARRSRYTRGLLAEDTPGSSLDDLTCRVCMRFCCPYHGEIQDCAEHDAQEPGANIINDVETDIINPPTVNNRLRVAFPDTVDTAKADVPRERRTVQYWQPGGRNASLNISPNDKSPFYPCHHPGVDCKSANCSCYVNKIPCEKTCACPQDCLRKFQGCNCAAGKARSCFEDERCACWMTGRECDPDLCGDCGVRDVLDPRHRHDDKILPGRCHLASIQRGIPKHTIIGKSDIHGFGLYACEVIRQHEFIGEYKGEVITKNEAERRGAIYEHQNLSYLFTLNTTQEVDSTFFGNKTRFMNHATKSNRNVYARIILVNTVHRIGLYAQRNIRPGEELCFGYGPLFKTVEDQERGKRATKAQTKSIPRVRNANITKSFWDPELEEGERDGAKGLAKSRTTARAGPSRVRRVPVPSSDEESDEYTAQENDHDDGEEDEEEEDLYS